MNSIYNAMNESQRAVLPLIISGWFQKLDVLMETFGPVDCITIREELMHHWENGTDSDLTLAVNKSFESELFPHLDFKEHDLTNIEIANGNLDVRKCIILVFFDFLTLLSDQGFIKILEEKYNGTNEYYPIKYDISETIKNTYEQWINSGHFCFVSGKVYHFIKACPVHVQEFVYHHFRTIEVMQRFEESGQHDEGEGYEKASFFFLPRTSVDKMKTELKEMMDDPSNHNLTRDEFRKKAEELYLKNNPDAVITESNKTVH